MTKKLSRRDAIKLLGAATGAAMLANLPSKWKTPELASGVLPAHAQTSTSILLTILSGIFQDAQLENLPRQNSFQLTSASRGANSFFFSGTHIVKISEPIKDIPLVLVTTSASNPTWAFPNGGPDGDYLTDDNGEVIINLDVFFNDPIDFIWAFKNPSDGVDVKKFTLFPNVQQA